MKKQNFVYVLPILVFIAACTPKNPEKDPVTPPQREGNTGLKDTAFPPVLPPNTPYPSVTPAPEADHLSTSVQILKPKAGGDTELKDIKVQSTGSLDKDQSLHKSLTNFGKTQEVFLQGINRRVEFLKSFDLKPFYLPVFEDHYKKNVTDIVGKSLFYTYDTKIQDLNSLRDAKLYTPPEKQRLCPTCKNWEHLPEGFFENSKSFFVNRSKEVFEDFYKMRPLNEQGILARKCAFLAFEAGLEAESDVQKGPPLVADDIRDMEILYITVLAMQNIAKGRLDVPRGERSFYEFCTQKNLLTGENLHESYVSKRMDAHLLNTPRDMGRVSGEQIKQQRFINQKKLIDLESSHTFGGVESFTKSFTQKDIVNVLDLAFLMMKLRASRYNIQ